MLSLPGLSVLCLSCKLNDFYHRVHGAIIADMEFKESKLWVRAFIIVERESQKGMVVGKGGEMIREIRLAALKDLKRIFDWKIDLDLRVKTGKDWRHNDNTLRRIIGR